MKFKELTNQEYRAFAQNNEYYNFVQSPAMKASQQARGMETYCVGVVNDHDEVIAATQLFILVHKRILKVAHIDYGFLMDYNDQDVFNVMTKGLDKFLKQKKVVKLLVSPYLIKYDYDQTESVARDMNHIEAMFKNAGFTQQHRKIDISRLINLMFVKDLSEYSSSDELLKSYEPNLRRMITKGLENNLIFEHLSKDDLHRFKAIEDDNADRNHYAKRDFSYYESVHDAYTPLNEVVFLMLSINIDEYRERIQSLIRENEQEIQEIQSQENVNKKKLNRIKSIEEVMSGQRKRLKDVEGITQTGKIDLAGLMIFKNNHEMTILKASQYEEFETFNGISLLYYYAMKMAMDEGIQLFNFYGTSDIDDPSSKGYQIYDYKKKFGGYLVELIEPFEKDYSFLSKLTK